MTPARRTLQMLDVASTLLLIGAVATAVWPVRVLPRADGASVRNAVPLAIHYPTTDSRDDAGVVVSANILSGSRHAPVAHYVSPELMADVPDTPPPGFVRAQGSDSTGADSVEADSADAIPALYGIVNLGNGSRALLRLASTDANPILLSEGDQHGGYRVMSITRDRVLIVGPTGQRTLRLSQGAPSRGARRDSTGNRP